jgi:nucleotide-binding universal stress UspA family protein
METAAATSETKNTVLIAIDASVQAEAAFDWYINYAHTPKNELLLVHVADPPFVSTQQVMYMSKELWEEMLAQEKEKVQKLEDKFADKMRAAKVAGRIKAVFNNRAGEALVDIAKEKKPLMIVMGTRGMGTMRRTILGSVSDYVLHHAHCPVMIYRTEAQSERRKSRASESDKN